MIRFLFFAFLFGPSVVLGQADFRIGAWGDEHGDLSPKISFERYACHSTFSRCEPRFAAKKTGSRFGVAFLSNKLTIEQMLESAAGYSRLSKENPLLSEVGGDDFVDFLRADKAVDAAVLRSIVAAVKAGNPALRFGITLYTDEVRQIKTGAVPALNDSSLRQSIDRIVLYQRSRRTTGQVEGQIRDLRVLFPRAQIDFGIYNYDRTGKECRPGKEQFCNHARELEWLDHQMELARNLRQRRLIDGIEFYPGNFDSEIAWSGWKTGKLCLPSRVEQCARNSREINARIKSRL